VLCRLLADGRQLQFLNLGECLIVRRGNLTARFPEIVAAAQLDSAKSGEQVA
jgi:hypothetical protein